MMVASMERICGFIVVRKPEYAANELLKPTLRVVGKTYQGVDRLRWEDFDLAYCERRLPRVLLPIWQELDRDRADFSGLKLFNDYQKAKEVLSYSGEKSEIIAIWSPELEDMKGASYCEMELTFLGIDCFAIGEWSVLLSGVYARPECFPETITKLNQHGLLTSDANCNSVFDSYLKLASTEVVEPLMKGTRATNIRVFELR
jgi:hypothetical protein